MPPETPCRVTWLSTPTGVRTSCGGCRNVPRIAGLCCAVCSRSPGRSVQLKPRFSPPLRVAEAKTSTPLEVGLCLPSRGAACLRPYGNRGSGKHRYVYAARNLPLLDYVEI